MWKEEKDYYARSDDLLYTQCQKHFKKDFPEPLSVDIPEMQVGAGLRPSWAVRLDPGP